MVNYCNVPKRKTSVFVSSLYLMRVLHGTRNENLFLLLLLFWLFELWPCVLFVLIDILILSYGHLYLWAKLTLYIPCSCSYNFCIFSKFLKWENIMKRNSKRCWSSTSPISTQRTITSHRNRTHAIQKAHCMMCEIRILAWDNLAGLNRLMGS